MSTLPECEACGFANAFSLIDPLCAFVCQRCTEEPNVGMDHVDKVYRLMRYCSCGKQGVPNEGSFFWCGSAGCYPDQPLMGYLTYNQHRI